MLQVTDDALKFLLQSLQRRDSPDSIAMRLVRGTDSLEIAPDRERTGDRSYAIDDRTVLVVDGELAAEIDDRRLCIVEAPGGRPELRLAAPV